MYRIPMAPSSSSTVWIAAVTTTALSPPSTVYSTASPETMSIDQTMLGKAC